LSKSKTAYTFYDTLNKAIARLYNECEKIQTNWKKQTILLRLSWNST